MQETQYFPDPNSSEVKRLREYFISSSEGDLQKAMKSRFAELEVKGHTLVRRQRIGRNDPCPCMSGKKFKKCCINKTQGV